MAKLSTSILEAIYNVYSDAWPELQLKSVKDAYRGWDVFRRLPDERLREVLLEKVRCGELVRESLASGDRLRAQGYRLRKMGAVRIRTLWRFLGLEEPATITATVAVKERRIAQLECQIARLKEEIRAAMEERRG